MSIFRKVCAKMYCKNCTRCEELHKGLCESNTKLSKLTEEKRTLNSLRRFNAGQEAIVYISPEEGAPFCITVTEELSSVGRLNLIVLRGYILEPLAAGSPYFENIVTMRCYAEYENPDEPLKHLKGIEISDFVVDKDWRGKGFGSRMMKELIRYAAQIGAQYIRGFLSWVDIGMENDEHRAEWRERLCRFYERHGFCVTPDDKIRLDVEKTGKLNPAPK